MVPGKNNCLYCRHYYIVEHWLLLAAFTGLNEIMLGIAGFCLTSNILYAIGANLLPEIGISERPE
jgi:hypothetical protein